MGEFALLSRRPARHAVPRAKKLKLGMACGVVAAVALFGGTADRSRAAGEVRTLSFFNIHTNETTTITFKRDGQFVPGALEQFNTAFRDWRKNEQTKMDPALLDLLWEIHSELGSKVPIQLICGYRSRGTNEMLRRSVGGQASESRHILGKAADVQFPDVPLKALRYSALIRERGGVGYYPTSAIPFVHIDTDRVRHWPNLPKYELALLFPSGHTQHHPAEGGSITPDDVRVARVTHQELSVQVANFFDSRAGRRAPIAVAGLDTPVLSDAPLQSSLRPSGGVQMASFQPPQLVQAPRLVDRPSYFAAPSATEQARLMDLVQRASFTPEPRAAAPRLLAPPVPAARPQASQVPATWPLAPEKLPETSPETRLLNTFVAAPDFDEDHPEELSYRPFPIAPLLTETASADDPALATMVHPDVARTLELLDSAGAMPPMRLRPTVQMAGLMWTQQFTGDAVKLDAIQARGASSDGLTDRRVRTQ